eukprot:365508-Chlamydomonas_euryale.AAC.5
MPSNHTSVSRALRWTLRTARCFPPRPACPAAAAPAHVLHLEDTHALVRPLQFFRPLPATCACAPFPPCPLPGGWPACGPQSP